MALPFTPEQRETIRARLMDSARAHALSPGVKKTSLEMLTTDAGISKSSFYKFFDSKEQLFLEVAAQWESQIIASANKALTAAEGKSDKGRAADMVYAAFKTIYSLGIIRFLHEDLPEVMESLPQADASSHYLSSAKGLFSMLHHAQIHFTEPDDVVLASIEILYMSILHINQIGTSFFPALAMLVVGACDRLVAG